MEGNPRIEKHMVAVHDELCKYGLTSENRTKIYNRVYSQMTAVVEAEREACAKECEKLSEIPEFADYAEACFDCAEAIRQRGEK